MTYLNHTRSPVRHRFTLHEAIMLLGSRKAASYMGRSHNYVKRWMRQNMNGKRKR